MSLSVKVFIVLVVLAGAIYSLTPMLRGLSDGPDLTPQEFEVVLGSKPRDAQVLVKRLDDYRVPNKLEAYGHGKNIAGIKKGIEADTEKWFELLTELQMEKINWLDEPSPSRIARIMEFNLVSFENKRDGEEEQYFVYLDEDYEVLGWRNASREK